LGRPIAWLAQAGVINDESIANGQGKQLATLLEANWLIESRPRSAQRRGNALESEC
jgi:hypothetical protein